MDFRKRETECDRRSSATDAQAGIQVVSLQPKEKEIEKCNASRELRVNLDSSNGNGRRVCTASG